MTLKHKVAILWEKGCQIFETAFLCIAPATYIVSIVLSTLSLISFAADYTDFRSVADSWNKQPIQDILFSPNNTCPPSYLVFEDAKWPGVVQNCDCRLSSFDSNLKIIRPGKCTNFDLLNQCTDGAEIPPISLSNWRGSVICVRRGGTSANLRPPINLKTATCPPTYMRCGGPSLNTTTCQPDTDVCPLSWLDVTNGTVSIPPLPSERSSIINDTVNIYMNISSNNLPITDIVITEGTPCISTNPNIIARPDQLNVLANKKYSCTRTDPRYISIDYQTEAQLLISNQVPEKYISDTARKVVWQLSYRIEVQWDDNCPVTRREIYGNRNTIDYLYILQVVMLAICLFQAAIMAVIFPAIGCMCCRAVWIWNPLKLHRFHRSFLERFHQFDITCDILWKTVFFISIVIALVSSVYEQRKFDRLARYPCTNDATTISTFSGIASSLADNTSLYNILLFVYEIIEGVILFTLLAISCYHCCKRKKKNELKENEPSLIETESQNDNELKPIENQT